MVYFITGLQSSGKTTYANRLKKHFLEINPHVKVLILDGDNVRAHTEDKDFSDEGREAHIMNIARFASICEKQNFIVIIALVSPDREIRNKARKLFNKSMLIYLPGGKQWKDSKYDVPDTTETLLYGV